MSSILDRVDVDGGCISPERRLFVGVIAAAVMDATGGVRGGDHGEKPALSKARARAWFADGDEDFQTVCTLAGYEPATVRKAVLAYLDRATHDPSQIIKMPGSNIGAPRRSYGERATTMSDVADHAGVSIMTVARVLDGKPNVSADAAARVLASIEALGYAPSNRRTTRVH